MKLKKEYRENKKRLLDYIYTNYSGILIFTQGGMAEKEGSQYWLLFSGTEVNDDDVTELFIIDSKSDKDEEETIDLTTCGLSQFSATLEKYFGPGHFSLGEFMKDETSVCV